MVSLIITAIMANLAATGCALLLLRRGATRRLRLLTLAVGLMSLSQTASLVHAKGMWLDADVETTQLHQMLSGCLSLLAIYLLGREMYERAIMERKLRLTEHEGIIPFKSTQPLNVRLLADVPTCRVNVKH